MIGGLNCISNLPTLSGWGKPPIAPAGDRPKPERRVFGYSRATSTTEVSLDHSNQVRHRLHNAGRPNHLAYPPRMCVVTVSRSWSAERSAPAPMARTVMSAATSARVTLESSTPRDESNRQALVLGLAALQSLTATAIPWNCSSARRNRDNETRDDSSRESNATVSRLGDWLASRFFEGGRE